MSKNLVPARKGQPRNDIDKSKSFNLLKANLKEAQSQFFKFLNSSKNSQPDKLHEEYKFVTFVKNGEAKLVICEDNAEVLKIDEDLKNKNLQEIKRNFEGMNESSASLATKILNQIKSFKTLEIGESEEVENFKKEFDSFEVNIEEIVTKNVSIFLMY